MPRMNTKKSGLMKEEWEDFKDDCGKCLDCPNNKECDDRDEFVLSTQVGCPSCKNEKVYMVHCHNCIWKVCEKCKTVFFCQDAVTSFTDVDMERWLKENPSKNIKAYEKMKLKWLANKYSDYKHMDHPELAYNLTV